MNIKQLLQTSIFIGVSFISAPINVSSQDSNGPAPVKYFQKYFGAEEGIGCEAVSITKVGKSYYILGNYDSRPNYLYSDANTDIILLKLDDRGILEEVKKMGNNQREIAHSIIENNNNIFVSGITFIEQRKFLDDVFLVRFDKELNKTGELSLGEPNDDAGVVYMGGSNDGFFLSYRITGGEITGKYPDGGDKWSSDKGVLSFFDKNMRYQWSIGLSNPLLMITSAHNINDNYFCFGTGELDSRSIYMIKTNDFGKLLFQRSFVPTIGKVNSGIAPKAIKLSDQNFLVFTEIVKNNNTDILVFKVDQSGSVVWSKTIGTSGNEKLRDVVADPYNKDGIVLVGSTSAYGSENALLVFIDKNGEISSSYASSNDQDDIINSICIDAPSGFIACGTRFLKNNGSKDVVSEMWFLKLDKDMAFSRNTNSCWHQTSLSTQPIRLSNSSFEVTKESWFIRASHSFAPHSFGIATEQEICSFEVGGNVNSVDKAPIIPATINTDSTPVKVNDRNVIFKADYTTSSKILKVKIYDQSRVDGDIVSVFFNNEQIISKKKLVKKPVEFEIEITEEYNSLVYYAENVGEIPPNTGAISIDDGKAIKTFVLSSDIGKSEAVRIIKTKK